jgi:prophage DNA circulation protein
MSVKKKKPTKKVPKKPKNTPRAQIDWDAIEKEYCLGQKTTRTIGHQFGVSHVSVIRKAKKEGWVQDKTKEIQAKTNAGLASYQEGVTKKSTTLTKDDIEKAVQTNIQVVTNHRKDIRHNQQLISLLSEQLKDAAENREELAEGVADECKKADGTTDYQKRARLLRALALPAHSTILLSLTAAQKNLVTLERQAYNIDRSEDPEDSLTALLKVITQKSKPLIQEATE